jgi:hypothetical protein
MDTMPTLIITKGIMEGEAAGMEIITTGAIVVVMDTAEEGADMVMVIMDAGNFRFKKNPLNFRGFFLNIGMS